MPAPQQRRIGIYDEAWRIPRPETTRVGKYPIEYAVEDSPGYALARLLGVVSALVQRREKHTALQSARQRQEAIADMMARTKSSLETLYADADEAHPGDYE